MDRYYLGLLNYSERFLKASKELTKNLNKEFPVEVYPVPYYLLAHALELALKAYISYKENLTEKELKKLGHNLEKISKKADINNTEFEKQYEEIIKVLNFYYKNKEFEYFKKGFKSLPVYSTMEEIVEKIIKHIKVNIL